MNNLQAGRMIADGRLGDCRGNQVLNNVFFACPRRIYLGRVEGNLCYGNLFDAGDQNGLFDVQDPAPNPKPRLAAWQASFGQDRRSLAATMEAALDTDGRLRFSCGKAPETQVPVARLGESTPGAGPGPFDAGQGKLLREGKPVLDWSVLR